MSDLMTVREAAEYLRVHPQTVRTWIRKGALRVRRIGAAASNQSVRLYREEVVTECARACATLATPSSAE